MLKKRFLALVFGLILITSGYGQANTGGSFFFSTGFYYGIFNNRQVPLLPYFNLNQLNVLKVGFGWEMPFRVGNLSLGLEGGFSSGSRFGGRGGVDYFPINFTSAFAFRLAEVFYLGPRLNVGPFIMRGPEWNRVIPTAGARLEAELRSVNFPFGLYVAGGIDVFMPLDHEVNALPLLEVGLRFPRGRLPRRERPAVDDAIITAPVPAEEIQDAAVDPIEPVPPQVVAPPEPPVVVEVPPPVAPPVEPPAVVEVPPPVAPPPPVQVVPPPVVPPVQVVPPQIIAPVITPVDPIQLYPPTHIPLPVPLWAHIIDGIQGPPLPLRFEPDSTILIEYYRPIVTNTGRQLAADSTLQVLVRAFAVPLRTEESRYLMCVNRARVIRDYFIRYFGIAPSRIILEAYGAEITLDRAMDEQETYWCAELIIIEE